MPERYARYFIKITGVRCERLQDISDYDCELEGIVPVWDDEDNWVIGWSNKINGNIYESRRQAFAALIDKINGKVWEANPYVFVYNFKLIKNK